MRKKLTMVLSLILVFLFVTSISVYASMNENQEIVLERENTVKATGFNQSSGYVGEFKVYLPESKSNGKITVRILSPNQSSIVYFTVKDPTGRIIWNKGNYGSGVLPNNGNEIISPQFNKAIAGYYTVNFTALYNITFQTWVYNW